MKLTVVKWNWGAELLQWSLILAMFIVAAASWSHVPDRIPIHWNLRGEVDGYGGRFEGLLLLPCLSLGLYLLLLLIPRFDPGYRNYQSFATAFHAIRISLTCFLAAVYAVTVLAAWGESIDVGMVIPIAVALLLLVLGNFMGKIRPNWFVGVRTPWTLSSKESWNKTHRLAGWLFMLMGLSIGATAIVRSVWMFGLMIFICIACSIWMVVYSYLVYRSDPNRTSPSATSPSNE